MENCLVQTLKATVNNSNLLKMGEIKIKAISAGTYSGRVSPTSVVVSKDGTVISKDSYGNFSVTCEAGDLVSITPKYSLTFLIVFGHVLSSGFDGVEFNNLLFNGGVEFDDSDYSVFKDATSINLLQLRSAKAVNVDSLCGVSINKININGDSNIKMDIKKFAAYNPVLYQIIDSYSTSRNPNTWDVNTRPSSYPIISVFPSSGNLYWTKEAIEGFLKNMANCQICAEDTDKKIVLYSTNGAVTGIDDAVASIKAKGYSVTINGTQL
jgi:hypothetical protein